MNKKTKTYTAIDFARYHSGNMETKEMHALEKAALEDPFLADALEGYMHTESATEDMQHLKSMLAEKTKAKKVYSIASVSQNVWWRVAAIFILIGIAGYLFFDMRREEGGTIAKNQAGQMKQQVNQLPAYDSPATAMTLENEKKNENAPASGGIKKSIPEPVKKQSKKVPGKKVITQKEPQHFKENIPSPKQKSLSVQKRLEDTTVSKGDYARITINDHQGKREEKLVLSELNKEDSKSIASPTLLSADTQVMSIKSTASAARSINRKNAEISDLTVSTETQKRSLNQKAGIALNGKTAGVMITLQSPLQPIEGTTNYYLYIIKNKKEVSDSNDNPVKGTVQLEFSINKKGKPINIQVVKSDCPLCEKQAISLLGNGPLWKGDADKKGEVIIAF